MPAPRWNRLKDLFSEAIAVGPAERPAWIAEACGDDASLRAELEALLKAHDAAGQFLNEPALSVPEAADAVVAAVESAAANRRAPKRCGEYRIVRELGRGGMGIVYLGTRDDDQFEKLAAIKVVSSDLAHPMLVQRFRDERRILASLDHPNIARLLDAGTTETGLPFVVMEYVEGETIDVYCSSRALPIRERLTLFRLVCDAVEYSHQHLVVHRDIKARNILVTPSGVPKLLDFGIAKLLEPGGIDTHATQTAFRALTPESASPEQVRGEPVTVATDVYSLGVLLYRLLTDRGPYRGDMTTESAIVRAICDEEPMRPSEAVFRADGAPGPVTARELRGDLDLIVLKALRKDRARRYHTVEQLAEDVSRYLDGRPILARPDTILYRTSRFVTRHKTAVAASALATLLLIGSAVIAAREARIARLQQRRAEQRFGDVRRLANSFLFEFHDAIADLPGSTKARELVVRRATEYLNSLSSESGNDRSLQRELAAAYERVGDVQGLPAFANLGDTPGALQSHRNALALREGLANARPIDATAQRELATTYQHLSMILSDLKDPRTALDFARKAFAIQQKLLEANPGVEQRSLVGAGYHHLGEILGDLDDWTGALENFRKETDTFEAVLASDPGNRVSQRDLGIAYKKLGAVLERQRDFAAALANYRKAVALDEQRARVRPNDQLGLLDLSFGYASIGHVLSMTGDIAGSLENYERALSLREQAAAADPNDVNTKYAVLRGHLSIGQVLRRAGRQAEAIQRFQQALGIALARYTADPTNGAAREWLANVYGALAGANAELASVTREHAEAIRLWRETRSWSQKALATLADKRVTGTMSTTAKGEMDSLKELVAKSDRALTTLPAQRWP